MIENNCTFLYTVSKCRLKDDVLYGPVHGSMDANVSACGLLLDHHYWVIDNTWTGTVTCKNCLDITVDDLYFLNKRRAEC